MPGLSRRNVCAWLVILTTAPVSAATLFVEPWSNGAGKWVSASGTPVAIDIQDNGTQAWQHVTDRTAAGRIFTKDWVEVTSLATYCLSADIRADAGVVARVGVHVVDSNLVRQSDGEHWLLGRDGDDGGRAVAVVTDNLWRHYRVNYLAANLTRYVVIRDELSFDGAAGSADIDDIRFDEGECVGPEVELVEPRSLHDGAPDAGNGVADDERVASCCDAGVGTGAGSMMLAVGLAVGWRRRRGR